MADKSKIKIKKTNAPEVLAPPSKGLPMYEPEKMEDNLESAQETRRQSRQRLEELSDRYQREATRRGIRIGRGTVRALGPLGFITGFSDFYKTMETSKKKRERAKQGFLPGGET